MKEFIEKLIGRLEEEKETSFAKYRESFELYVEEFWRGRMGGFAKAIAIVNQFAEEYKEPTLTIKKLLEPNPALESFLQEENPYEVAFAEEYKTSIPLTDYDSIIKFIESEIERTESFSEHETQINIMFYVKELKEKHDNDFCEWRKDKIMSGMYVACSGYVTYLKDFKFCPYCGKKIKVVEPKGEE